MNQCKHQVIDYFNGHLQGEEKTQFEAHIKHCSACKEELEELTSLMSDIPFLAEDQIPPAGMKDRILSQVFEEETVEEKNSQKKSSRLHLSQTKLNRCKRNETSGSYRSLRHCFSYQQLEMCISYRMEKNRRKNLSGLLPQNHWHRPHHQKRRVLFQ